MSAELSGPAAENADVNTGGRGEMTKALIDLQDLRRRLYVKAKTEPSWRFWGIYVHVCKMEMLREAFALARSNNGAPGIDGVTFEEIEAQGVEQFLEQIRSELIQRTYRPLPARRREIPKDGGKVRVLSIPAIRDRVVQGALKLILEPIFEADFQPGSYGYRLKRTAHEAISRVAEGIVREKTRVIDIDLKSYFDSVRHDLLLAKVAQRVNDQQVMHLLKLILKTAGNRGVPQGGVITPLTQKRTFPAARCEALGARTWFAARGRSGRYWDRVADGDCVVTDENLFDEKANDTLAFRHVQRLCRGMQPSHERRQRLGQPQVGCAVVGLIGDRFDLSLQCLLLPTKYRHSNAQLLQRDQGFLIGCYQALHALVRTC
jgi:hypothetical protein